MKKSGAAPRGYVSPRVLLLVDREDDSRGMYAEFLRFDAWQVEEAEDGRDAFNLALAHQPDIIVTDTHIAGITGYELCQWLRREASTSAIPIIVVTADAFAADVERAKASGADLVLTKPCLPETLSDHAQRLLADLVKLRSPGGANRDREGRPLSKPKQMRAEPRRDTVSPPTPPPALVCPACERPLIYQRSHLGDMTGEAQEQWDYFECRAGCGSYQYRHVTGTLRKIT